MRGLKKFLLGIIISTVIVSTTYAAQVTSDLLASLAIEIVNEWSISLKEMTTILKWCSKTNKKFKQECAEALEKVEETFATKVEEPKKEVVKTTKWYINKYYYNQLTSLEKEVYDALEEHIDDMKSGNYRIEFVKKSQSEFVDLLNSIAKAKAAFFADHVEIFWIDTNKLTHWYRSSMTFKGDWDFVVCMDAWMNGTYLKQWYYSKDDVNKAIDKIEKIRQELINKRTWNVYEDIKMVHNWMVNNIEYDLPQTKYDIDDALLWHFSVCDWYSKTFKFILDWLWIESIRVTWYVPWWIFHAWNQVKINWLRYGIDVTWDDPTKWKQLANITYVDDPNSIYKFIYYYFLKWSKDFFQDHENNDYYHFSVPRLTENNY